jgi:hypothetical protein
MASAAVFNTGGFPPAPLERRKCDTSLLPNKNATFILTFGNQKGEHVRSVRNKECKRRYCETDSAWLERFRKRQLEIRRRLVSALEIFRKKGNW